MKTMTRKDQKMFKLYLKERMHETKLFRWNLNVDLLAAVATLLLMWASYYGLFNLYKSNTLAQFFIFIILTNILLNVMFPVWWVTRYKKRPLSDLGISKKLIIPSIFICVALAIWKGVQLPELIQGVDWLPQLIMSALIFFEPFFVFGWLQIRFEKSFGIIPAIILAASSFIIYQIGSAPTNDVIAMFPEYLLLATAFGVTNNVIAVWPIYWCVGSTVNQLRLGMHSDWDTVAAYIFAIIIQFGYIYYIYKKSNNK